MTARILIVDDEPLNVDYLEQELEGLGFVTESAADGREALERVAAAPPDLVLLDVMMPVMDGISALRVLKQDPATRLIPVVLMTALNAVEDRVRGIEAGADDFLSKPVDERELLARIRTALRAKRAIDETVDELEVASAYLERYGRRQRDVAVLAVAWQLRDPQMPDEAASFVGRRPRAAAAAVIRAHGGLLSEDAPELLVAVFEGPDLSVRLGAAVEAALAIGADDAAVLPRLGIAYGPAEVGSTRVDREWRYGGEGQPVDRASELARAAGDAGVWIDAEAARLVGDRLRLEPGDGSALRVVGRVEGGPDRAIRTILMTDIVGSTRMIERIGDRAWGELAARHDEAVRSELGRFGGDVIDAAGDSFLAAFGSPGRAVRCALAVAGRVDALGLRIRAGVHTGEVELVEGRVQGIALSIAARTAARANPSEVLVTATSRELAAGSGLIFTDRGEHRLEGVTEPRRLYAAVELEAPAPPPADAADAYPAGLTAREVDVLRLVAVGLSDAEAAEQLFLSVRTVNAHLRSIYRKLGVRSRAAAGRFAEEHGLL